MAIKLTPPPEGWGEDKLTEFLAIAQNNEIASFANIRQCFDMLISLDAALLSGSNYCMMQLQKTNPSVGFLLFVNAHNHFRAAVRHVMSGQCVSCYPVGRAALESAVYGWFLVNDKEADTQWHNKPEKYDRDAFREWARKFKFSNINGIINQTNSELAKIADYLHQLAIDFGAHPNTDALYSNFEIIKQDGKTVMSMKLLHTWGDILSHSVKFVIEIGLVHLELLNNEEVDRLFKLSAAIERLKIQFNELRPVLESAVSHQ